MDYGLKTFMKVKHIWAIHSFDPLFFFQLFVESLNKLDYIANL